MAPLRLVEKPELMVPKRRVTTLGRPGTLGADVSVGASVGGLLGLALAFGVGYLVGRG